MNDVFTDRYGHELKEGDKVLKASRAGNSALLEIRMVRRIENGRLYLDGSGGSYVQNFDLIAKVPRDYPALWGKP